MKDQLTRVKETLDNIRNTRKHLESNVTKFENALDAKKQRQEIAKLSVVMAQKVYDEKVATFFKNLEDMVSYGLSKVFSKEYRFSVEYRTSGCKFWLASEDTAMEPVDLITGHGGGVIQVTAFILHVYALSFSSADKVLILDEPFAQISKEYKPVLAVLIYELTEKLGFQFILVSHDTEMMGYLTDCPDSKLYKIGIKDKSTVAEEVSA